MGGSKIAALLLIDELRARGHEPLIALHREGRLSEELDRRGLCWHWAPSTRDYAQLGRFGRYGAPFRAALPLARFLRAHGVDVVHTNDMHTHMYWSIATRLAGCRFVWHQHQPLSSRARIYSRLANAVPIVSHYCRNNVSPSMRRRSRIVDNPFLLDTPAWDRQSARNYIKHQLGLPDRGPLIGVVGNLTPRKRPGVFVEAAARIAEEYEDAYFLLVGDARGETVGAIHSRIKDLGLQKRCYVCGQRFPIDPWLAGLSVVVCPAVREAFGRVPVEAALACVPVIASDDGGHTELVKHGKTGLLFPPDDVDALADAMRRMLDRPGEAGRFAQAAERRARDNFSVTRHADEILGLYETLLNRNHAGLTNS